jgi:hypothetical protein
MFFGVFSSSRLDAFFFVFFCFFGTPFVGFFLD